MKAEDDVVVSFRSGSASGAAVQEKLQLAWSRLIDSDKRAEIAALLDLPESAIVGTQAPFRITSERSNFDPTSIALMVLVWAGSEILLGAAVEIARDEVKRRMKLLWHLVEPELRSLFDTRNAIGAPVKSEGDERG